jgi:hypothetical protein
MGSRSEKSIAALGFLTVCDLEGRGLVGGYLLLNATARPLEFHCTAPVKPSRAQEILYGPTLEPFLYGEQIGRALVEKSSASPLVVLTDLEAVLAARAFVASPFALVLTQRGESGVARETEKSLFPSALHRFECGLAALAVPTAQASEAGAIVDALAANGVTFDVTEPFERIREAVREAHRDAASRTVKASGVAGVAATAEAA